MSVDIKICFIQFHRFCVSRTTISNIFNTLLNALHEMLYVGVVDTCFPSQLKCKGLYLCMMDIYLNKSDWYTAILMCNYTFYQ